MVMFGGYGGGGVGGVSVRRKWVTYFIEFCTVSRIYVVEEVDS